MSVPPEVPDPTIDASSSIVAPRSAAQKHDSAAYRQIFKATSVIGGAQVISIVIGIARTKVFALLVGPAGVGLMGLLMAVISAASLVAQMGMNAVGPRQIAEAHAAGDSVRLALVRRALMIASLVLAVVGGGTVWLLREPVATYVLGNATLDDAVGWVGLGVALSVGAGAQAALIQGMRRMWDLVVLQIGGAILLTAVGLPAIWLLGEAAIPFYVVLMPLSSFVLGHLLVSRVKTQAPENATVPELMVQWRMFIVLGLPMMGAALLNTLTTLWIQTQIKADLGIGGLGLYVAANTIALQYAGLVLTAMAGDYFPRLSGVIGDQDAARRLVNQQTEVALLLAGPMILGMFALAPWVMLLLYSDAFVPAADVLRWQSAATLLKVATWPMGFILLARGAGRVFFLTELAKMIVMAAATYVLVQRFGLVGAGMGQFAADAVNLPLMLLFSAPRIRLIWSSQVLLLIAIIAAGLSILLWPVMAPSALSIAIGAAGASAAIAYLAIRAVRTLGLGRLFNFPRRAKL